MGLNEKSRDMEANYANSVDPWGNRKRGLYQKIFKKAVQEAISYLGDSSVIHWYDVGCGGGNIFDTILENIPEGRECILSGCDISESALKFIRENYSTKILSLRDLEHYNFEEEPDLFGDANIISFVDVMYYFGEVRDYRKTLDEIWKAIRPGTIVVVSDSLIPYQRRSYFMKNEDCTILDEYTDYTAPVSENKKNDGTVWNRYLKVKIYRKD